MKGRGKLIEEGLRPSLTPLSHIIGVSLGLPYHTLLTFILPHPLSLSSLFHQDKARVLLAGEGEWFEMGGAPLADALLPSIF
jgi:hypothetical protein